MLAQKIDVIDISLPDDLFKDGFQLVRSPVDQVRQGNFDPKPDQLLRTLLQTFVNKFQLKLNIDEDDGTNEDADQCTEDKGQLLAKAITY